MTATSKGRSHLVERAAAALGAAEGHNYHHAPPMPPAPPRPPVPPSQPGPERPPIAAALLLQAGMVPVDASRSRLIEEIAVIQDQVLRNIKGMPVSIGRNPRLVLVTSALPGEGKTFSALNIAAGIASASGRPAMLVDVDGKPGGLTDTLGCNQQPGLRTLTVEPERASTPIALPTERPGLSFLPYGVAAPDAPVVPSGAAISTAVLRLAAAWPDQILVLDTPPCLSTSEASVLAPIVGQVVMVVQAERVQRDEVEAALDMISGCPSLQLLLNRTQMRTSDSFGASDYGTYRSLEAAA
ncbi:CpsD/CapB family tyrosine-protein kinase [Muricoccus radiodurans]|uniref:CpsD/CapB family tyrosine-protein kinase n=1 Tax=Muricoccus radiodurans TaxID=2231721 RepID=UPI003CF10F29